VVRSAIGRLFDAGKAVKPGYGEDVWNRPGSGTAPRSDAGVAQVRFLWPESSRGGVIGAARSGKRAPRT
jgi:hypothetical protein